MDIQEVEVMAAKLYDYFYEFEEEFGKEKLDYEKLDMTCRQVIADVQTMKEIIYELKRKETVK